jgi:P-type Ca2+ transporter type 2C
MDDERKQLNYYRLSPDDVLAQLHSRRSGLELSEIHDRLDRLGPNALHKVKRTWIGFIFLRQFKNLLVILLLISALFAVFLNDSKTATILVLIAVINALVGFFQEFKAETMMDSLQQLVVPQAKVLRDSQLEEISSTEVVLGDIIYVEEGDSVPADLRILDEEELATNDFALTGESNPSRKFVHAIDGDVPLGNRHNILFMGTTVALGRGHGVVIGTGMNTELGRIAHLSQNTKTDTSPLQKEMGNLATRIAQATFVLALILTVISLRADLGLKAALLFAISISAAMIPNGLVAEVNVTLAKSASRMAKERALVKKLSAVETLGATNIIATDKTGTLTKNEMTVQNLLIGKHSFEVTGSGYEVNGHIVDSGGKILSQQELSNHDLFFKTGALASNAKVNPPDHDHHTWYVLGDPTEGALITLARKAGIEPTEVEKKYQEIKEFQFDSARKRMSSVRKYKGKLYLFLKGAPESVISLSSKLRDGTVVRNLRDADRAFLMAYNERLAGQAMRNLAFAYRELKSFDIKTMHIKDVEKDLTFLGIVSELDPLRETVPAAMQAAQAAHIKVSIVTGDFPTTAEAIARKAQLTAPENISVVLGEELHKLADSQILQLLERGGAVFSRVSPEDKLRVVDIAKQNGLVIAVTGDGINDAPALKRADIGVAMGKTGTDVAKEAAEIVLLDDSFDTLVKAAEQGRLTFKNIRKAALCAMFANSSELFTVLIGLVGTALFNVPIAITALQILAIDIIAQIFPVTALGWDPAQGELMHEKPRNLREHILNWQAVTGFVSFGFLCASLAYCNFLFYFVRHDAPIAMTNPEQNIYMSATILTYLTIVLCQFVNIMLVRSDEHESFFTRYLWSNKVLLASFVMSLVCILNIIYNPLIQPYFHAGPLSAGDWFYAILAALLYLAVRLFQRYSHRHSRKQLFNQHDINTINFHLRTQNRLSARQ